MTYQKWVTSYRERWSLDNWKSEARYFFQRFSRKEEKKRYLCTGKKRKYSFYCLIVNNGRNIEPLAARAKRWQIKFKFCSTWGLSLVSRNFLEGYYCSLSISVLWATNILPGRKVKDFQVSLSFRDGIRLYFWHFTQREM